MRLRSKKVCKCSNADRSWIDTYCTSELEYATAVLNYEVLEVYEASIYTVSISILANVLYLVNMYLF
jgi:ribosomal protein S26